MICAGAGRRTYPGLGLSGEITPLVLPSLVGWLIVQCRSWSCLEEEGGWPRLRLLLLLGVAMWWLVLSSLLYLVWLCMSCVSYVSVEYLVSSLRWRGLLGGFIDQPTQGYNGNMPSRWVRIVGVRCARLGPAWGLVVHGVPLGAGPACLGGLCAVLSIVMAWPSRAAHSVLRQAAACCRQR